MHSTDVCIAGAGIIGLSLALELTRRGLRVTILDRSPVLAQASTAAAGMLAANDPANPPQLQSLSQLSITLYPAFLDHLHNLSDIRVPFQTELTVQSSHLRSAQTLSPADLDALLPHHTLSGAFDLLDEHSVDPRQLARALASAAANTSIRILTHTPVLALESSASKTTAVTASDRISAACFVDCTGAWAATIPDAVLPRKGQMLAVALPLASPLSLVLRTEDLYIVPRTSGPNSGRAIIGATVEDVGFDTSVHTADIARLHAQAAHLLPALRNAPILEQWAGLRPGTPDQLPLLGPHPANPRHLFATGHFRNGILLAPATARVLAQLIVGEPTQVDLARFAPARLLPQPTP